MLDLSFDTLLPIFEGNFRRYCDCSLEIANRHLYLTVFLEIAALKHKISSFFHPILLFGKASAEHLHPRHLHELLSLRHISLLSILNVIYRKPTPILLRPQPTHDIEHVAKLLIALLTPKKSDDFTHFLSSLLVFLADPLYKRPRGMSTHFGIGVFGHYFVLIARNLLVFDVAQEFKLHLIDILEAQHVPNDQGVV